MMTTHVFVVALLFNFASSASIWGGKERTSQRAAPEYDPDPASFNPTELLDPKTQKPELWARAITELQDLKKKPSCSRLAATMLMNDCQLLEGIDSSSNGYLPFGVEGRLEDYINGYAASLAICDIEAAQGPIPEACEPFRETALLKFASRRRGESIHVSKTQIDQCMNGLINVPTSWTSWTSSRDRATLFCRASRIDIEKDQLVALHQQVAQTLQDIILRSQEELQHRERELAEQRLATTSYFRDILTQLGIVGTRLSTAISQITDHAMGIKENLQKTSSNAEDVSRLLVSLRKTLLKSAAEHASVQNEAFEVTTDLVLQSQNAHAELQALRTLLTEVYFNATSINAALHGLQQQQDTMNTRADHAYLVLMNLTERMQGVSSLSDDHVVNLEKVKEITSELKRNLEQTSTSFSSLSGGSGILNISWPLLVFSPTLMLVIGSYGLPPSMIRNFGLGFTGFVLAAFVTIVSNAQRAGPGSNPSTFTHLASRNTLTSLILTPAPPESSLLSHYPASVSQSSLK